MRMRSLNIWISYCLSILILTGCGDPRSKPVETFLDALKEGDADQLSSILSGPAYIMFMNFVPIIDCPQTKQAGHIQSESQKSACLREFYTDMDYSIVAITDGNNSSEAVVTVEHRLHGVIEKKEYNVELIEGRWKLL